MYNNYIYIAVMALVSYTIRILPLTLIRKPIKNQFIQSFLYYVPYVTLSVMTFPAIVHATRPATTRLFRAGGMMIARNMPYSATLKALTARSGSRFPAIIPRAVPIDHAGAATRMAPYV